MEAQGVFDLTKVGTTVIDTMNDLTLAVLTAISSNQGVQTYQHTLQLFKGPVGINPPAWYFMMSDPGPDADSDAYFNSVITKMNAWMAINLGGQTVAPLAAPLVSAWVEKLTALVTVTKFVMDPAGYPQVKVTTA